jgi:UDP-N-acetylglucosamine 2-epimerase (non-hydrolysing)
MSGRRRILTVFGTRPEAIKLFPLLHALAADERFESRVCVTGQHRELLDQVLTLARIAPDHDLAVMQAGQPLDGLTADLMGRLGDVMDAEAPDWVVVQGDTTSAMTAALCAYYRQIPVCHVEAGLRSGDIRQPWPEEVNRKVITAIAALHCAPTETAAAALARENADPAAIHVTGNTVIDALRWMTDRIGREPELVAGLAEVERRFGGKRLIAVTCHRRESFGAGMEAIATALSRIAARGDVALVFPLHPNPNVSEVMRERLGGVDSLALLAPLDYPQFARLLSISTLVLTDSGGVQEEAPALGTPVLVMREATERPEGVAAGTAKLVGTEGDRIVAEVERLLADETARQRMARAPNPFGDGRSAARIVELLAR